MAVRRLGLWRRIAWFAVKPPMLVLTRRTWSGAQNIPTEGGLIIVCNHISEFDPLVICHFVYDAGRWPQFLAKSSLFDIPVFGWFLRSVRQIPVYRGTADAVKSLEAAIARVRSGDSVIIYPEGTIPDADDHWPGRGKTGVARLFLETGAPVVPVVSWGPQRLYHSQTRKMRLRPRTPVTVSAGPPIDLSAWAGQPATSATLHAITEKIMSELRELLAVARGEPVPVPEVASEREE